VPCKVNIALASSFLIYMCTFNFVEDIIQLQHVIFKLSLLFSLLSAEVAFFAFMFSSQTLHVILHLLN
jgi:hypothetical protein